MEVLTLKNVIGGLIGTLTATFFVWTASTLVEVDKRTAITEVKVKENNEMIKVLWTEFIKRKDDGDLAGFNVKTNFQTWW
jgi:L-cystine uptake protein TcyP (sodium:dicarboxylate symporter family)